MSMSQKPGTIPFTTLHKQLSHELTVLASESKRRKNSQLKQTCDKSINILTTVHSNEDLIRHPDFIVPFILAFSSRNVKLTSIAIQCLPLLSSVQCIPKERLSDLLVSFVEATHLATDIQLKILQVLPLFFKTYARYIYGHLVTKLLQCCSNLFSLANKSIMVTSAASAAMQQLIDEIFQRLSYEWITIIQNDISGANNNIKNVNLNDLEEFQDKYSVLINNQNINDDNYIKVNTYRYDANRIFANLISLLDNQFQSSSTTVIATSTISSSINTSKDIDNTNDGNILVLKELPMDYGLEILESILENNMSVFLDYPDLQFLLRVKAVPFLLRCITTTQNFPIAVRCYRCIKLLLRKEYLKNLNLELQVVLSLLIHVMRIDSKAPDWQRVLSLELFNDLSDDFELVTLFYLMYDNSNTKNNDKDNNHNGDKMTSIIQTFLLECLNILKSNDYQSILSISEIIEVMDMPIITHDFSSSSNSSSKFIQLLDKVSPPSINITYIIWLVLSITDKLSEELSELSLKIYTNRTDKNSDLNRNTMIAIYTGMFEHLFELNKIFLYSTSLDNHLFQTVVRSFQKLTHCAGILQLLPNLNKCLNVFAKSIIQNIPLKNIPPLTIDNNKSEEPLDEKIQPAGINLNKEKEKNSIEIDEDTNNNNNNNNISSANESLEKHKLYPRIFTSRHVNLFRALMSLSISLGTNFDKVSWEYMLLTWQWVSYYIYGPSIDFMESYYSQDVPIAPSLSRNDINSIEVGVLKLFENTPTYSTKSFKTLIQSLNKLSDTTLNNITKSYYPVSLDGTILSCVYNKGFYITQIGEICSYNTERFLNNNKGKKCWEMIMSYFVKLISSRNIPSYSLRHYVVRIFNDIIKGATEEIGMIEDINLKSSKFKSLEQLVINAMMDCIRSLSQLTTSKDDIYQGVIITDAEIILQLLLSLKGILNEFGDMITVSWPVIFHIINVPFDFWSNKATLIESQDIEDSSLLSGLQQKRMEMIQGSYDVFKLISDDFLQSLPLETVRYVIDTSINYVNQDMNLNISFSSISQFWLVSDYLKSQFKEEFRDKISDNFEDRINAGSLMEIITSKETSLVDFYNGLWIYLLESLVKCSKDKRLEVKNGAIQTFFRIIDSHSNYLPSWKLIYLVVIKPLLTMKHQEEDLSQYIDFYDITISGLVTLYPTYFSDFDSTRATINIEAWITLYDALQYLFHSKFAGIKFVAISNYKRTLESVLELQDIPNTLLTKSCELWLDYNIVYSDFGEQQNSKSKSDYDCVYELILTFPYIYQLVTKHNTLSSDFVERSLTLFNTASKYPLLPPYSKDNIKPSSLQESVLKGLKKFENSQSSKIELLILFQLSSMTTLMFDTREKIMKKLAPKLSDASLSRIPTFEAISFRSLEVLCERLNFISNIQIKVSTEKIVLKILRNLSDTIIRKPLIILPNKDDLPMWVLASKSFRKLSQHLFELPIQSLFSDSFISEFQNLFVKCCCLPIQKSSSASDFKTADNDILEYDSLKSILLEKAVIKLMTEASIHEFILCVWNASFAYVHNDIENAFISQSDQPDIVIKNICTFEYQNIFGSTVESKFSTKISCSKYCLDNLIDFLLLSDEEYKLLRHLTAPYLTLRIALVLKRYIANENLIGRAPIPKVRKIELLTLLNGLCKIFDMIVDTKQHTTYKVEIDNFLNLHPLILKTIPVAHKISGLQDIVLNLSLHFAKLDSLSKSKSNS
ncbi:Mon2p PWA37_002462 [Arxiozyma heterogenica]|uniref:Mon2p n=1 Tax=Arxiozyma heterogenica TaxID=278026 RepID=UPI002F239EB9